MNVDIIHFNVWGHWVKGYFLCPLDCLCGWVCFDFVMLRWMQGILWNVYLPIDLRVSFHSSQESDLKVLCHLYKQWLSLLSTCSGLPACYTHLYYIFNISTNRCWFLFGAMLSFEFTRYCGFKTHWGCV